MAERRPVQIYPETHELLGRLSRKLTIEEGGKSVPLIEALHLAVTEACDKRGIPITDAQPGAHTGGETST